MIVRKKKIALICGSDIVAHREMVHAVKHLVDNDFEPVLFYPEHLPSKNEDAQQSVFRDYAYVERLILRDVVFPYLENNSYDIKSPFPTPNQIAARYGLEMPVAVADINSPDFYEILAADPNLIGSISLRCTQKFGAAATAALKSNNGSTPQGRFLINAHSGLLPEFRGLYSTPRAIFEYMQNPADAVGDYGATIHHIEPYMPVKGDKSTRYSGIDTGNIIDLKSRPVDPTKSVYAHNIELSNMVGDAVKGIVGRLVGRESLRGYPQDNSRGRYFSYGTPDEVQAWEKAGLVMFEPEEVVHLLTETFISDNRYSRAFENMTREAIYANILGGALNEPTVQPVQPTAVPRMNGNGHSNGTPADRRSRTSFGKAIANDTAPTVQTPVDPGTRGGPKVVIGSPR